MYCTKCSTPIPEGGLFCPECGQKMTASIPSTGSTPYSHENFPPTPPPPAPLPQNQDIMMLSPAPPPPASLPQNQGIMMPAPSPAPLPLSPARESSRSEMRRQKRRHARGFWFYPLTNIIILGLSVSGWFFVPREIAAYATGYDLSSLMAKSAQLFQYNSLRDGWDAAKDAVLAIALAVLLLVLTVMGLAALVRIFKRIGSVSRRKKEWKTEKKELLRKELLEGSNNDPR